MMSERAQGVVRTAWVRRAGALERRRIDVLGPASGVASTLNAACTPLQVLAIASTR